MHRKKRKKLKQQAEAEAEARPKKKRKKKYPQSRQKKPRRMVCCTCSAMNMVPRHHFLRVTAPRCSKCLGPLRRATNAERKSRSPARTSQWLVPAGTRVYFTADGWSELSVQKVFVEQPTTLGEKFCFRVGDQYMKVKKEDVTTT